MSGLISENGWPVLDRPHLWFTAAGARFAAANADVATCATDLIERFNTKVEPLAGPVRDEWSWAKRPVRDQISGFSNHASATAFDLNATSHPRGVHGTFNMAQIKAVRAILNDITDDTQRPVFRWGGDYVRSPVDSMHFEILATPAQVKQAARRIRDRRPIPPPQEATLSTAEVIELKAAIAAAVGAVWTAPVIPYNDPVDRTKPVDPAHPLRSAASMVEQMDRLARRQGAQIAANTSQIATLTAAVAALADASPSGVKAAFEAGAADLQRVLSQIDITVTTGATGG